MYIQHIYIEQKLMRNPVSDQFRTNLVFLACTLYSCDFAYWIGFEAVMAFKTICELFNSLVFYFYLFFTNV